MSEPRFGQAGYKSKWTAPKGGTARVGKPRKTLEERFWEKVHKSGPNGCWQWMGSKNGNGYGQIWSMEPGDPANIVAHHASLRIHGIQIPAGKVVDHICKNKGCVNPFHLRFVTTRENVIDNSVSPWAVNKRRTHCRNCGLPLSGDNLAIVPRAKNYTRHGHLRPGVVTYGRQCLNCYPQNWRYAVVPRPRPPGSKWLPTDPDYDQRPHKGHSGRTEK